MASRETHGVSSAESSSQSKRPERASTMSGSSLRTSRVPSTDLASCRFRLGTGRIFEDPIQKVKVAFLSTNSGGGQVELVEPAGEGSPVSRFLALGGGLHHLCYEVDDLDPHLPEMRYSGRRS